MKKLLTLSLLAAALLVTACTLPSFNPDPCDNNLDEVDSLKESWNGMTYALPWCWEKEESTTTEGKMLRLSKPGENPGAGSEVIFYTYNPVAKASLLKIGEEDIGKKGIYTATLYAVLIDGYVKNLFVITEPQTLYIEATDPASFDTEVSILSSIQFTTP